MSTYDPRNVRITIGGQPLDLCGFAPNITLKSPNWIDYYVDLVLRGHNPDIKVGGILFRGVPYPLERVVDLEISMSSDEPGVRYSMGVQVVDVATGGLPVEDDA